MEAQSRYYRQTKIIITLGPATDSPACVAKLIAAGVDIIRLNMAHATREWVAEAIQRIRDASRSRLRLARAARLRLKGD